jgi:hypothetical protein
MPDSPDSFPRGRMIGADEAGYGPNLGPLVVTATQWDLPAAPHEFDLARALRDVLGPEPARDGRLQITDSKRVYHPGKGLAALELPVLALFAAGGLHPRSWSDLWRGVMSPGNGVGDDFIAPWYREVDFPLPLAADAADVARAAERLCAGLARAGVRLAAVRSDVVTELRFNRLADAAQSKGTVLTEVTLALIRSLWSADHTTATLIIGDKHGGRSRYAGALVAAAGGAFVATHQESRSCSRYVVNQTEFRFERGGEKHLPVAAASMVSKYVREVAMQGVNTFWRRHLPDLKPTQGYPQDAVRFRAEIAAVQRREGLADDLVWRRR